MLYFNNEELKSSSRTLSQCGVKAGDILYLVLQDGDVSEGDDGIASALWGELKATSAESGFKGTFLSHLPVDKKPSTAGMGDSLQDVGPGLSASDASVVSSDAFAQLVAMGFEESSVLHALQQAGGDIEVAADILSGAR